MSKTLVNSINIVVAFFIGVINCDGRNQVSTYDRDVTLTLKQKSILDEFAGIVSKKLPHKYMIEEMYLIRWLRVKNYNIPDAVNYLLQNIQWREENRMDFISASEDWSDMARDFKYHIEGQDRAAQPLLYVSVDELDIRKSVVNGKTERLLRFVDKGLEEAAQIVNTLGKKYKNVTRGQIIINLFGYNLVEHGCLRCIPVILRGILSYETHYPEYVDQLILLNTPSIAQPLINAATALLSESTRRSLKIYGTNKRDNLKILDTMFERDQIPLEIGGTKVYGGQALDYEDDW